MLVGLDAEEEGKDGEDGEDKAVDQPHPQPDAHPEFEPSGHLGSKQIKMWTIILIHRKVTTSRFLPSPANLSREEFLDG